MGGYSGWMRNNPWEPWCLVVPWVAIPGDAMVAMRSIQADAEKRGCKPSLVALPLEEVPSAPMTRQQLRGLKKTRRKQQ